MEYDDIIYFESPVYMDYTFCDGEKGRILDVYLIEVGTWIATFNVTTKFTTPYVEGLYSRFDVRIEDITSLSYGFMSDLYSDENLSEKRYYNLNLKKHINKRKVFMYYLEILWYKFLGHLICLCPFSSLKDRLLLYAEERFPVD